MKILFAVVMIILGAVALFALSQASIHGKLDFQESLEYVPNMSTDTNGVVTEL
jgi:hypothetical protein